MKDKVKTSILIDEELWRKFKVKASVEGGLKGVSKVVEEALEENLWEVALARALENMAPKEARTIEVAPVKPEVKTSAGMVVREMRDSTG